jgi:hypothetical protein
MPNAAMSVKRKLRLSVVYEDLGKSWRRARAMRQSGRKTVRFISFAKSIVWRCRRIIEKSYRRKRTLR